MTALTALLGPVVPSSVVVGDVTPDKSGTSAGTVIFLVVVAIAVVLIVLGLVVALRRRRRN